MQFSFPKNGNSLEERAVRMGREGPTLPVTMIGQTDKRITEALIDTGASISCVTPRLSDKLNLRTVRTARVSGVSPAGVLANGEAKVVFAVLEIGEKGLRIPTEFAIVNFPNSNPNLRVLLGRSFLRNFDMYYEGSAGRFSLTWQPPSSLYSDSL